MLQALQTLEDKKLVDRLFPHIIKKIDGATLLQKIDVKTLTAKVLPYLDVNVQVTERQGPEHTVTVDGPIAQRDVLAIATCAPEETNKVSTVLIFIDRIHLP